VLIEWVSKTMSMAMARTYALPVAI